MGQSSRRRTGAVLLLVLLCLIPPAGYAATGGQGTQVVLFYNKYCGECQKALDFLDTFSAAHPDTGISRYDISDNETNLLLFREFEERYSVPGSPVPTVFTGSHALAGVPAIESGLEAAVAAEGPATSPTSRWSPFLPVTSPVSGMPTPGSAGVPAGGEGVQVTLFYNQHCGECQKALDFLDTFSRDYPGISVTRYDIFDNETNLLLFQEFNERYGTPNSAVPAVFVGGKALVGVPDIESGLEAAVSALHANASGAPPALYPTLPGAGGGRTGTGGAPAGGPGNGAAVTIVLFYNQHCGECQKALDFLDTYLLSHPGVALRRYDLFNNETNRQLFSEVSGLYGISNSPVPALFIGDRAFVGMAEIEAGIDGAIAALQANATSPTPWSSLLPPGNQGSGTGTLTVPMVIAAALVDGINPCAFAVLIFLLVTLMAMDSRRRVLLTGSVYIAAVFLFYFLSGLGIFAVVQLAGVSKVLAVIASAVALLAGAISLRDAFREGGSSSLLAIPSSRKGIIEKYAGKTGIIAAFILGILVGMFELPCTGGIYIAILALLSTEMALTNGIPLLLLYNVVFILPLVAILLVVSFGVPAARLEEWRRGHRRGVRVLMGIVMIALGLVMLSTLL